MLKLNRLLFSVFFILTNTASVSYSFEFIGTAYSKDGQRILYLEEHRYLTPYNHRVEYKEADGRVFAEKRINYQNSYIAPEVRQLNRRNGELIETKKLGEMIQVLYRENDVKKPLENRVDMSDSLVIDAGFDHYIRLNWEVLVSGEKKIIRYLLPSLQKTIDLSIQTMECEPFLLTNLVLDTLICWRIAAENWMIRILIDPLFLVYERSSQRIMKFVGRSNICDEYGDYEDVIIRYQYNSN